MYKVDTNRERVSQYLDNFNKLNVRNIQQPMKKNDITTFEKLDHALFMNVFDTLEGNDRLPIYVNKGLYEEKVDLLKYKNQYCLNNKLLNFRKAKKASILM